MIQLIGLAGVAWLLGRRRRSWWTRTVPAALGVAAVLVVVANWVISSVWRPFPDPLPVRVVVWAWFAVASIGLAVARSVSPRGESTVRRLTVPVALIVVLSVPAMKINAFYGYYPSLGDALGAHHEHEIDFADLRAGGPVQIALPGRTLAESWRAPRDLPPAGVVTSVEIPGVLSGFRARTASIYLPPAYLPVQRPALPVVVLIAGQPGAPQDWLTAGRVSRVMDGFAHAHGGLAPVVVMPDATGSRLGNPMCLDSNLGQVESYLTRDVPDWIGRHLQVDVDHRHWMVAGFSYGGTCALQLSVRASTTYPTFLDISGQEEPTLGTRAATVRAAYGGDEARFRAVNPMDIMAGRTFTETRGIFAVGDHDREYGPQADRVAAAARSAGVRVDLLRVPGTHSWTVATAALGETLPMVSARLGLSSP